LQKILWQHKCEPTDTIFKLEVFDCERSLTNAKLAGMKRSFLGDHNKNWNDFPLLKILMIMRHVWAYTTTSPPAGRCGIRLVAIPMHTSSKISFHSAGTNTITNVEFFKETGIKSWSASVHIEKLDDYLISIHEDWNVNLTLSGKTICLTTQPFNTTGDLTYGKYYSIYTNEGNDKDCSFVQPVMNATLIAEANTGRIPHNDLSHDAFEQCIFSGRYLYTCIAEQTYYDKYSFDINYKNSPKYLMKFWRIFGDVFRNSFGSLSTRKYHDDSKNDGEATMIVEYEPFSNDPTVQIVTPQYEVTYEKLPVGNTIWKWLYTRESWAIWKWLDENVTRVGHIGNDILDMCEFGLDYIINVYGKKRPLNLSQEWLEIMADNLRTEYGQSNKNVITVSARSIDQSMVSYIVFTVFQFA
jgi:hypothetical protein